MFRGTIALIALLAVAATAVIALPSAAEAAPPNDDFPGTAITSLPFTDTFDTTEATNEPDEPSCGVGARVGVWYNFTPSEDVVLLADTYGSSTEAFISVYRGSSVADLSCIAMGVLFPPYEPPHPTVPSFPASAGETYYFQVGSQATAAPPNVGVVRFNLRQGRPPENDNLPGMEITGLPFKHTVDTTFATAEAVVTSTIGPTVWYNFTPAEAVTLWADTFESDHAAWMVLWNADLRIPAADVEFSECATQDRLLFTAAAGEKIYFQVGGAPIGVTGTLVFSVEEYDPRTTPQSSPNCPQEEPLGTGPSATATAGTLPAGGGRPPSGSSWLWVPLLGGVLLAVASVTLARAGRRQK